MTAHTRVLGEGSIHPTPRFRSLPEAVVGIKAKLHSARAHHLALVKGFDQQLSQVDALYPATPPFADLLVKQLPDFLTHLQRLKDGEPPRLAKFEGFTVDFGYMDLRNLIVFELPSYEAVNVPFLSSDVELLLTAMRQSGFGEITHWNGAGCYTLTIKLPNAPKPLACSM